MAIASINFTTKKLKFDIVQYIKDLRNAGVNQEVAEIQASGLEYVLDMAISASKDELQARELATKKDLENTKLELQKEIAELRYATLKFVIWTGCFVSIVILGGMFTMLKLMLH